MNSSKGTTDKINILSLCRYLFKAFTICTNRMQPLILSLHVMRHIIYLPVGMGVDEVLDLIPYIKKETQGLMACIGVVLALHFSTE